jgi:hypothetical protein
MSSFYLLWAGLILVRFEVFMVVTVKNAIFWVPRRHSSRLNTSLQAAIQDLMSSLPMDYAFIYLAVCNDIIQNAIRIEVSVVEAWEIISFSILSASLLCINDSVCSLNRSECLVLRCQLHFPQ